MVAMGTRKGLSDVTVHFMSWRFCQAVAVLKLSESIDLAGKSAADGKNRCFADLRPPENDSVLIRRPEGSLDLHDTLFHLMIVRRVEVIRAGTCTEKKKLEEKKKI